MIANASTGGPRICPEKGGRKRWKTMRIAGQRKKNENTENQIEPLKKRREADETLNKGGRKNREHESRGRKGGETRGGSVRLRAGFTAIGS